MAGEYICPDGADVEEDQGIDLSTEAGLQRVGKLLREAEAREKEEKRSQVEEQWNGLHPQMQDLGRDIISNWLEVEFTYDDLAAEFGRRHLPYNPMWVDSAMDICIRYQVPSVKALLDQEGKMIGWRLPQPDQAES